MAVITYTTLCPECKTAGAENRLMGSGDGSVYCDADHKFESIDAVLIAQTQAPAPEPVATPPEPTEAQAVVEETARAIGRVSGIPAKMVPETPESPTEPAPEPPERPQAVHVEEEEAPAAPQAEIPASEQPPPYTEAATPAPPFVEDLELPPELAPAMEAGDAHDGESPSPHEDDPISTTEAPGASVPVNGSGSASEPPHGTGTPPSSVAPGPSVSVKEIAGGEARFLNVNVGEMHYVALKAEAENQGQSVEQYFQDQIDRAMENRWLY